MGKPALKKMPEFFKFWIGQNVYAADHRFFVNADYYVRGTTCVNTTTIAVCETREEAEAALAKALGGAE